MNFIKDFKQNLFQINEETFEDCSLALFEFQYHNNLIYKRYCDRLNKSPIQVKNLQSIPFLPIEFFKNHRINSSKNPTQKIFKSSGTTSNKRSEHHVKDIQFYHQVCSKIFENAMGKLDTYELIALLPSYIEQGDSSLISMIDNFINQALPGSGFYLDSEISAFLESSRKTMLFGVSYALLDLPKTRSENIIVIETGGMKGRKKEITRQELHSELKERLSVTEIWSEYGMTELLSQAYGKDGMFSFPEWAAVKIRDINDPFCYVDNGKTGGVNIIDLANIESCAFIETKDIGIVQKTGHFEILGRFDNSDLRGCNLLI